MALNNTKLYKEKWRNGSSEDHITVYMLLLAARWSSHNNQSILCKYVEFT